jgi:hypothetical protein
MTVIVTKDGRIIGISNFVDGLIPLTRRFRCLSEEEAMAHASYLERHVSSEAALDFIDRWASGYRFVANVKNSPPHSSERNGSCTCWRRLPMKKQVVVLRSTDIKVANPIAKDLRDPKYRSRVVRNKKVYTRKGRKARDHMCQGLFLKPLEQ